MNIIQQPNDFTPVGQPIYLIVDSSNKTEPDYKYVVDIFVDSDKIARLRANPEPEFGYGVFNLSRVLDSQVDSTFKPDETDLSVSTPLNYKEIDVEIGEEYFDNGNFVADYDEENFDFSIINTYLPDYKGQFFDIDNWEDEWFTHAPKVQNIGLNESAFLNFADPLSQMTSFYIRTFNDNDVQQGVYRIDVSTTDYHILKSGTKQLANSSDYTVLSGNSDIIHDDVAYYRAFIIDGTTPIGDPVEYRIGYCSRFLDDKVRVHFQNELGSIDSYTFTMKNRREYRKESDSVDTRGDILTASGMSRSTFRGGHRDYHVETTETLRLNSDWLSQHEMNWLSEIINSPNIYIENERYGIVRGRVITESHEIRSKSNDKLVQLAVSIEISQRINRR